MTLMLLASGLLVLWVSKHRRSPFTWACAALAAGFAVMFVVRDADWILVLGLLTSAVLTTAALTNGRSTLEMVLGAIAWPVAGLRGMPWLGPHAPGRRRRQQRRGRADRRSSPCWPCSSSASCSRPATRSSVTG